MLTFAEEILLLRLDDEGEFLPVSESAMECALVGAVLMDLSFALRIDTEPGRLMVIDSAPTDNPTLDRVLGRVVGLGLGGARRDTREVVETLSLSEASVIQEEALSSLVERGILERVNERLLWVFRSRRYPVVDGRAEREVKLRIMDVLLSDVLPDPRDVALICLVDVCGLVGEILSKREMERAAPRIEQLRKMDLIGREVSNAITEIERALMIARARSW